MWRLMPEINLLTLTFQASFDDQQETEVFYLAKLPATC
jgi:hypothetical protein